MGHLELSLLECPPPPAEDISASRNYNGLSCPPLTGLRVALP